MKNLVACVIVTLFCGYFFVGMGSICNAAQLAINNNQNFFIDGEGILWGWGSTTALALPYGENGIAGPTPFLTQVQAVAAGGSFVLALRSTHEVWGWGDNSAGQLTGKRVLPSKDIGKPQKIWNDVRQVGAGIQFSFVVKSDGSLWGRGLNLIGTGLKKKRQYPHELSIITDKDIVFFARILAPDVVQFTSGGSFALALVKKPLGMAGGNTDTEILMGWGNNSCNQLGNYELNDPITPVILTIPELKGKRIRKITTSPASTAVLTEDGEVWRLGVFGIGMCHEGTWPEELMPKKIEELSGAVDIAVGESLIWALRQDGTVHGWGKVAVSVSEAINHVKETTVSLSLTNVREIAAGGEHALALKNDGTVWAWGNNEHGGLGIGTKEQHADPVQVRFPPLDKVNTFRMVK